MNSLLIAANLIRRTIGNVKGFLLFILMPAVVTSAMVWLVASVGDGRTAVGYADLDGGAAAQHVIRALEQTGRYKLCRYESERELADMVADREVAAGFVIPAGFEEDWLAGRGPRLTLIRLMLDEKSVMLETDLDGIARAMAGAAAAAEHAGAADAREAAMAVLDRHLLGLVGGKKMDTGREGGMDFLAIGFSLNKLKFSLFFSLSRKISSLTPEAPLDRI